MAEAEVSKEGGVRVRRVVCAMDCGTVVNPNTVQAQIKAADVANDFQVFLGGQLVYEARASEADLTEIGRHMAGH